ncbi:nucleoside hydrolase [Sinirhodobacter populi]|uniref:Nucleoside hydrolase n=1 Tax=Paenirhodobacter populi TaxID=2306993 RepID=A0A443KQF6_9RHOB|nr:nucleoside hydrolase [Sinirhodobacter populi]RWR35204.1 nucleoside hydrolase [Sinirhodobacter populi]
MHKVIFDTDPGVDDALALYYLHRHPQVDLLAITTVFGNAPVETTTRNALFLKDSWSIAAPVAMGAAHPLSGPDEAHWPTHIHGRDGLGNIDAPEPAAQPDPRPAHQVIVDTIRAHPGEVTLVAVGRMTNLAQALRTAPDIAAQVKQVVVMGGAFAVPGNVTPAAEANLHGDALAADEVFAASWPVVAVGLDVTRQVEMTRAELADLARQGGPEVALLRDLSQDYIAFYEALNHRGMVVHDCCACVLVTDPDLFTRRTARIRVLTEGIGRGATVAAPLDMRFPPGNWDSAPAQDYCTAIRAEAVHERITRLLSARES